MTERAAGIVDGLDRFAEEVLRWHREQFVDFDPGLSALNGMVTILGATKVVEESGEFLGAVTKLVEGRRDTTFADLALHAYDELGDIVIASVGALRRLNELAHGNLTWADVVLQRWDTVGGREYRQ